MTDKLPLFIIPKSAGVKMIRNKHGIFITANDDMVDKVRFEGLVDPKDFGATLEEAE